MTPHPTPSSQVSGSCTPVRRQGRTLSLPVIAGAGGEGHGHRPSNAWQPGHAIIRHSRAGKWRALSLALVHVLIAIHVVQWLVTGMTVSPVEPSESMQTLRDGVVNAGFVFFALAILSTAVLGRFFCGWACHVVALQDLCSWGLQRIGVKPKPFRSRLLILVPLALALYMFVWPVVHREIVRPLFADARGRLPAWLGQSESLSGLTTHFLVEDFWATFPTWQVAIPFFFVCGFAIVYVLGAKGFCTYGCPYGGLFAPADLLAVGKIKVNDNCHHCGHCTAVCTSNVRVHEEVRNYGAVVDPGCMKCLDCVSVCPNDALSFGLGRPSLLTRARAGAEESAKRARAMRAARYDLTWPEELVAAGVFAAMFWCYRSMLNQVPMLMAVGMAAIGTFAVWKLWRLVRDANVRVQNVQLKYKGRVRVAGWVFALGTLLAVAAAAWSGTVRWHLWRGELAYAALETPLDVVLRPDFQATPAEISAAEAALRHYGIASPPRWGEKGGGIGWALRPDELVNIAYMQMLLGNRAAAEEALREVIQRGRPRDSLVLELGRLMQTRGATADEILEVYRGALERHADLTGIRDSLARDRMGKGDRAGAIEMWERAIAAQPRSAEPRLAAARFLLDSGDRARADELVGEAVRLEPENPETLLGAAGLRAAMGERDEALTLADRAAEAARRSGAQRIAAAGLIQQLGGAQRAAEQAMRGVEAARSRGRHSGQAQAFFSAGMLELQAGRNEQGLALLREAVAAVGGGGGGGGGSPWDLASIGVGLANAGMESSSADLLALGVSTLEQARDAAPSAPTIRHDLAVALYAAHRPDEAVKELRRAAELAGRSDFLAQRLAELLRERGQLDESDKWFRESQRRLAAKSAGGARPAP